MKIKELKKRSFRLCDQMYKAKEDVQRVAKSHGLTPEQTHFPIQYYLQAPEDPKRQEREAAHRAKIETLPPDVLTATVRADEAEEQFFLSALKWARALIDKGKSAKEVTEAMGFTLDEVQPIYSAIACQDRFATR